MWSRVDGKLAAITVNRIGSVSRLPVFGLDIEREFAVVEGNYTRLDNPSEWRVSDVVIPENGDVPFADLIDNAVKCPDGESVPVKVDVCRRDASPN
jgi:hypothetical protein